VEKRKKKSVLYSESPTNIFQLSWLIVLSLQYLNLLLLF